MPGRLKSKGGYETTGLARYTKHHPLSTGSASVPPPEDSTVTLSRLVGAPVLPLAGQPVVLPLLAAEEELSSERAPCWETQKVLEVLVEPGHAVEEGQPLLVLEAMKMENVIKATVAGTVSGVPVHQGDAVEKGALLIGFVA